MVDASAMAIGKMVNCKEELSNGKIATYTKES
jgi:hypothetical protein